jgi:hypothetical protein
MSSGLLNHHFIHELAITPPEVDNTLAIGSNTHDNHISTNNRRPLRCHKEDAHIDREAEVSFEEHPEDIDPIPVYDSDITVMNVSLRIGAIKNAFNDGKVRRTSVDPFRSSCGDIDNFGMQGSG